MTSNLISKPTGDLTHPTASLHHRGSPSSAPRTRPSGHRPALLSLNLRRVLTGLSVIGLTLTGTVVLGTAPAAAHAELRTVTPADGATLKSSPSTVSVTFNEPVTGNAGSVQLLDSDAKIVRRSEVVSGPTVPLTGQKLTPGRYVIRWSVASADGHVIVGATSFSVKSKTPSSKPSTFTLTSTAGNVTATLSGSRPGTRTFTVTGVSGDAVVELRTPAFGAPLQWKLTGNGDRYRASGVIPAAGVWEVVVKARTGTFDQSVYTGKVTIKK